MKWIDIREKFPEKHHDVIAICMKQCSFTSCETGNLITSRDYYYCRISYHTPNILYEGKYKNSKKFFFFNERNEIVDNILFWSYFDWPTPEEVELAIKNIKDFTPFEKSKNFEDHYEYLAALCKEVKE